MKSRRCVGWKAKTKLLRDVNQHKLLERAYPAVIISHATAGARKLLDAGVQLFGQGMCDRRRY
jgi:hypothetical protein